MYLRFIYSFEIRVLRTENYSTACLGILSFLKNSFAFILQMPAFPKFISRMLTTQKKDILKKKTLFQKTILGNW